MLNINLKKLSDKSKFSGFSLIELSIVLLILSTIAGAIFGGSELIESAKRNTVIADFQKFKLFTDQFKEKYEGIPGDLSDARSYFGDANTNNGNGDKFITLSGSDEQYLAWQHLAFAGYIDGPFTGNNTSDGASPNIGSDVPESPYGGVPYLYTTYFFTEYFADTGANLKSNFIILANQTTQPEDDANSVNYFSASLKPNIASSIDKKADDGTPTSGSIFGFGITDQGGLPGGNCFTNDGIESSTYRKNVEDRTCILLYKL